MSLADFGQKYLDFNKEQVNAVQAAETTIGLVPVIGGYISTGKSVLEMLGILKPPLDPLAEAVKALINAFAAGFTEVDAQLTMLHIDDLLGPSHTALSQLGEKTNDELQAIRNDVTSGGFTSLDTNTLNPISVLESPDGGYWLRPFFPEGVYGYGTGGFSWEPSDVTSGLVFDYRLTLPAYLQALTNRLIVAAVIFIDFNSNAGLKKQFADSAQFLRNTHDKIRGAILTWEQQPITAFGCTPQIYDDPNYQDFGTIAVEVYSTFHELVEWPQPELKFPPDPMQSTMGLSRAEWYPRLCVRYAILTMVRWKSVYVQIGLPKVAAIIAHLNLLATGSPTSVDGPTGDWSIRELAHTLARVADSIRQYAGNQSDVGDAVRANPGGLFTLPQDGTVSLAAILRILQTFSSTPYTSLRAALAQSIVAFSVVQSQ